MKKKIAALFFWVCTCPVQAQGVFTIKGEVKGVEEGTMISLFRLDGNVGSSIGVDTVCNGRFHFQKETLGDEVETLMLSGRSDKFPPHELQALGASGNNIQIIGENTLIRTWEVKSNVPEQVVYQAFINDSRALWDEYQSNTLLERSLRRKYAGSSVDEERLAIRAQMDSLQKANDGISNRIDANIIKRMKQTPVDDIWLEQLERLAMAAKYKENYPYREEAIALYERLTDDEKTHNLAMNAYISLFPPQVVEAGDEMAGNYSAPISIDYR